MGFRFEISAEEYDKISDLFFGVDSTIRIRILDFLVQDGPKKFSEIASHLNIIPSTLQNHLQKLVDLQIIHKSSNKYTPSLLGQTLFSTIRKYNDLLTPPKADYFRNHYLPNFDFDAINELNTLEFEIFTNMISILEKSIEIINRVDFRKMTMGGVIDLEIEKTFIKYFKGEYKNLYFDIIFTGNVFTEFFATMELRFIRKKFDLDKMNFYFSKDCEVTFFIIHDIAFLFLPSISGKMDFNAGLIFNTPDGVNFVSKIATFYKKKAKNLSKRELEDSIRQN